MNPSSLANRLTCKRNCLILAFSALFSFGATSQERAQADVSITSVTLSDVKVKTLTKPVSEHAPGTVPSAGSNTASLVSSGNLKCSITVHNENDDDANQTMLVVVVPVEVSIVSMPANATVYKAGNTSPFAGYLTFSLGNMYVGQNITVEFTFKKSQYGNKVGAYAFSASPDPNPANNYKDATY